MDSIMITATIKAHKHWSVSTVDIPGAFLHAYNDKDTCMLLCGCLAKLMVQVNPAHYRKYFIYGKKNKALLYVKLSKAIYGLLKSAILFYKKFVNNLKNYESPYIIKPYIPCVANATIAGLQIQSLGMPMISKYHTLTPTKSKKSVNTLHLSMATASWYIKLKSTNTLVWTSTSLWMVLSRY
jgi:hypothetical protein